MMVGTADTENRVVVWHRFEYTEALQAGIEQTPIRIQTKVGRGAVHIDSRNHRENAGGQATSLANPDVDLPEGQWIDGI